MKRITLYQDRQGTKGPIIGFCQESHDGWRFFPNMDSHKPSRRAWPTWEKCIPRWTGHPDRTISDRAETNPVPASQGRTANLGYIIGDPT